MRKFTQTFLIIAAAGLLVTLMPGCSAKAKAGRHLQRGDKYFDAGDYSKAEVEYLTHGGILQMVLRQMLAG